MKQSQRSKDVATVIKAQHARLPQPAAFNFEDLSRQAQGYVESVHEKAREILAQAEQDAVAIRQRAEKEGREAGQRAMEKLSADQVALQMKSALPALNKAIEELVQSRHAWLAHWESRAVHLATAIAARVVRREVAQAPDISLTLVREALEMAPGQSQITLRMNPDDQSALSCQIERLVQDFARLATLEIVADPAITRGGCRLETRHGAIDQQLETQLARIEAELTADP
jgi:flagellar assembly protein FliH